MEYPSMQQERTNNKSLVEQSVDRVVSVGNRRANNHAAVTNESITPGTRQIAIGWNRWTFIDSNQPHLPSPTEEIASVRRTKDFFSGNESGNRSIVPFTTAPMNAHGCWCEKQRRVYSPMRWWSSIGWQRTSKQQQRYATEVINWKLAFCFATKTIS